MEGGFVAVCHIPDNIDLMGNFLWLIYERVFPDISCAFLLRQFSILVAK